MGTFVLKKRRKVFKTIVSRDFPGLFPSLLDIYRHHAKMVRLAPVAWCLLGAQLAVAKPSPKAEPVRGSLTILSDNDLESK